jgi:hypothetical protein
VTARPFLASCAVLLAFGAFGALVALALPGAGAAMFPHGPHPVLRGAPAEVVEVFLTNASTLIVPLLFCGAVAGQPGPWRLAGDLAVAAIVTMNSVAVGLAIGHFGGELLAYLPHVPIEGAALAYSASTWLSGRSARRPLGRPLALVLVLVGAAAAVEVYATPHVH